MRLRVDHVSFQYSPEVIALRDVSLEVTEGEFVAILGQNGAGKTTLAKHFNGLLQPDQGSVLIGDWRTDDHKPAELATRVSYTFQNPDDQLFERTVRDEVAFGPKNLGLTGGELEQRVAEVLEQTGLHEQADVHPYDLQPNERKFVALAATLAMAAPIQVIDEPTTGQDSNGIERLSEILGALRREGRTVIVISHDIDFCLEHFDRAVLMADGRILQDGPMTSVLQSEGLLAEASVEQPQLQRLASGLGFDQVPKSVDALVELLRVRRSNEGASS